jgi:hypothetical protein
MRIKYLALLTILMCAITPIANADITGWTCADDGDGAIVMNPNPSWTEDAAGYHIGMSGTQYWAPAHIGGDFTTDTPTDPTVWIVENVDNQTGFTWTDYHIAIGMNKNFSIAGVVAPPDWTYTITAPAAGRQMPNNPPGTLGTVGYINYFAGTPIAVGDSGSFGAVVSFLGSVAFSTEQVPTPEPATLSILGLGAMALLRKRSK